MQAIDALQAPTTLTRYRLTVEGERALSEADVDLIAELVWSRGRRTALLEALQRMSASPLSEPTDRELFNARADAVLALDRRIAELEQQEIVVSHGPHQPGLRA